MIGGMDRRQPIAMFVEDAPSQEMVVCMHRRAFWLDGLLGQKPLNTVESIAVDDGLVLAIVQLTLMPDPADIDRIGKQIVDLAAAVRGGDFCCFGRGLIDLGAGAIAEAPAALSSSTWTDRSSR